MTTTIHTAPWRHTALTALAQLGCLLCCLLCVHGFAPTAAASPAAKETPPTHRSSARQTPKTRPAPTARRAASRPAPSGTTKRTAPAPATPRSRAAAPPTSRPSQGRAATAQGQPAQNDKSGKPPASDAENKAPTSRPGQDRATATNPVNETGLLGGLRRSSPGNGLRGPKRPNKKLFSSFSRTSFFWSQVLGMLVALAVIVLLIFLLLRWAASQMGIQTQTNQRLLKVVDRLSLEHKKGLWLIEAGDQYLLLATHEQGVTMLDRLSSRAVKAQLPEKDAQPSGFWERLRRGKDATPRPQSAEQTPDADQHQGDGDGHGATPADAQETPTTQESSAADAKTETPTAIPTQFEVVSDGKSSSKETP